MIELKCEIEKPEYRARARELCIDFSYYERGLFITNKELLVREQPKNWHDSVLQKPVLRAPVATRPLKNELTILVCPIVPTGTDDLDNMSHWKHLFMVLQEARAIPHDCTVQELSGRSTLLKRPSRKQGLSQKQYQAL